MDIHGCACISMDRHGNPWISMDFNGFQDNPVISWSILEHPSRSLGIHKFILSELQHSIGEPQQICFCWPWVTLKTNMGQSLEHKSHQKLKNKWGPKAKQTDGGIGQYTMRGGLCPPLTITGRAPSAPAPVWGFISCWPLPPWFVSAFGSICLSSCCPNSFLGLWPTFAVWAVYLSASLQGLRVLVTSRGYKKQQLQQKQLQVRWRFNLSCSNSNLWIHFWIVV